MDILYSLNITSSVSEWKREILYVLQQQPGHQLSLLSLMEAAMLHSRASKHPFNDALSALVEEKRVVWLDVPGQPIQICIPKW